MFQTTKETKENISEARHNNKKANSRDSRGLLKEHFVLSAADQPDLPLSHRPHDHGQEVDHVDTLKEAHLAKSCC